MEGVLVTLFGLCIGSFLNVAIIRLPKNESINLPASHCPLCLHPLAWYHNVPLFSWIFLRGKCAFCKSHISFQYPLVELSSAFLYAFIYFHLANTLQALLIASVFALLLALSIIDLRYKAVPDALSLPALILSFCTGDPLVSLQNGLLFMGAFAFLRFFVSALAKKEVMGEADIIIAGIIGALLGIKLGLAAIYISAVIALIIFMIIRKKGYELAFIPFLASGLSLTWLFETQILHIMELIYE